MNDVTADLIYVRLRGAEELYPSGYPPEALDRGARKIDSWCGGTPAPDATTLPGRAETATRGP